MHDFDDERCVGAGYLLCVVALQKIGNPGLKLDYLNIVGYFFITPVLSCFSDTELHNFNVKSCFREKKKASWSL